MRTGRWDQRKRPPIPALLHASSKAVAGDLPSLSCISSLKKKKLLSGLKRIICILHTRPVWLSKSLWDEASLPTTPTVVLCWSVFLHMWEASLFSDVCSLECPASCPLGAGPSAIYTEPGQGDAEGPPCLPPCLSFSLHCRSRAREWTIIIINIKQYFKGLWSCSRVTLKYPWGDNTRSEGKLKAWTSVLKFKPKVCWMRSVRDFNHVYPSSKPLLALLYPAIAKIQLILA